MSEKYYDIITGEELDESQVEKEPVEEKKKPVVDYDIITGDPLPESQVVDDAEPDSDVPEGVDAVTGAPEAKPAEGSHKAGDILPALKGMVSFFTIIRIPVDMKEFDAMERNFWLSPIVGALVGLVTFTVCALLGYVLQLDVLTVSVFALATPYLFSKFLHFDGLTDFGDGMICSSGDREKHIRALKDTLVGAGGVGVAIITILLTVVLYYSAAQWFWSVVLPDIKIYLLIPALALVCEILVKNAQVAAAAFGLPGNGMASRQVGCTTGGSLVRSTAVSLVLVAGICLLFDVTGFCNPRLLVPAIGATVASIVAGWWMARTANRNFGFVNGDILGATNEISRVVILLVIILVFRVC